MKKYNFNAGPSMLPREVVEQTAAAVLDYNGSGLSFMELSHRSPEFKPINPSHVVVVPLQYCVKYGSTLSPRTT